MDWVAAFDTYVEIGLVVFSIGCGMRLLSGVSLSDSILLEGRNVGLANPTSYVLCVIAGIFAWPLGFVHMLRGR